MPRNADPVEQHIRVNAFRELRLSSVSGKVILGGKTFHVYVAETPSQKIAGLEAFDKLGDGDGMLFPFEPEQHVTFHMGSVRFPIDILFLVQGPSQLKIAKIVHAALPGTRDHWAADQTVAVLEINGGLCKRLGVKVGDPVEYILRVGYPD